LSRAGGRQADQGGGGDRAARGRASLIQIGLNDGGIDIGGFIAENLPLTPVTGVEEVRLHLATPRSGLWRLAEADPDGFGTPYWAYPWGGGLALARYVLDHPEIVVGRRVLDLGAGSGLVGIAAAKTGAASVVAVDTCPYARTATALNAQANGVSVEFQLGDLLGDAPPDDIDLVLAGDLFYEAALAERSLGFLDRCVTAGIDVLVGDPWREPLPRERLRVIAEYATPDVGLTPGAATRAAVFAVIPAPQPA
jgi:predicted nicotinamide N-methyase